ncbi:MAG: helix-turn-helix transcriptional regulator [Variovorax sp.]|nr:helix-turn-helix transcriptional regulator [Variovorax sp.]
MKREAGIGRNSSFGEALKTVRLARQVTQETFDTVSNRTYVSALERGLKQPTLPKVDELARVLGVHPLTLLTLCYLKRPTAAGAQSAMQTVHTELEAIFLKIPKI